MTEQHPQTAAELGLMRGFPPEPAGQVTRANQLVSPYNRWSFQHETTLNCAADVWRGSGPVAALEYDLRDLDAFICRSRMGHEFSFGTMVAQSYTDGIVVLHGGAIIYERYLNGMQPHTRHAWASGSKSVTGTLAALLIHAGVIDADALISDYLPELRDSGFAGATVRHALDMTSAITFNDDYGDAAADTWRYSVALGILPPSADYSGPPSIYSYLPTIKAAGPHGQRFAYVTPNSDVLGWIIRRVLNQPLAEVLQERIWSRMGAERDAAWLVDSATAESAGSGLVSTLRDMARFGQLLLQRGHFNQQQILPAAVVDAITAGGDRTAFANGPAANPSNVGWSYHAQWWHTHNAAGLYMGLGYAGQILAIAPAAQLVIAKFSSYPAPAAAGAEFMQAFVAIMGLARALAAGTAL